MIKCWGSNADGQLGDGTTTDRSTLVVVSSITNATSIALGGYYSCITNATSIALGGWHSCALFTDGKMKCWGSNGSGQLGDGTTTDRSTPVVVLGITNATIFALGEGHSCVLLTDGTMKCWGSNYYGQLGDGSYVTVHPKPICRRHTQKIYQQILLLIHQQQRDLPPITRQVFNPPQIL
jgi:alpha-tubulin suppressor-like RCC1 family protein